MSFYNKYRPQTFNDVIGQSHITDILKQATKEETLSHVYLLVGPRGTGKTTTARLIAKSLNCTAENKENMPCNKCNCCTLFDSQSLFDVIEIDAASNTGVDDVRDLIEKSRYMPTIGRVKVYIIDEVHMLSKSAFNALLKILEEPPSHVHFVLATTEVHKVPVTIISRSQRFNFYRINIENIVKRLQFVINEESINAEDDALVRIAEYADGGLRDAIKMLEQIYSNDIITVKQVENSLGLVEKKVLENFIEFVQTGDVQKAEDLLKKLYQEGIQIVQFIKELLSYMQVLLFDEKLSVDDKKVLLDFSKKLLEKDFTRSSDALFELQLLLYEGVKGIPISNTSLPVNTKVDVVKKPNIQEVKGVVSLGLTMDSVQENMIKIIENVASPKLRMALKLVTLKDVQEKVITYSVSSSFHYEILVKQENKFLIEKSLSTTLKQDLQVKFVTDVVKEDSSMNNLLSEAQKIFS